MFADLTALEGGLLQARNVHFLCEGLRVLPIARPKQLAEPHHAQSKRCEGAFTRRNAWPAAFADVAFDNGGGSFLSDLGKMTPWGAVAQKDIDLGPA